MIKTRICVNEIHPSFSAYNCILVVACHGAGPRSEQPGDLRRLASERLAELELGEREFEQHQSGSCRHTIHQRDGGRVAGALFSQQPVRPCRLHQSNDLDPRRHERRATFAGAGRVGRRRGRSRPITRPARRQLLAANQYSCLHSPAAGPEHHRRLLGSGPQRNSATHILRGRHLAHHRADASAGHQLDRGRSRGRGSELSPDPSGDLWGRLRFDR